MEDLNKFRSICNSFANDQIKIENEMLLTEMEILMNEISNLEEDD
jgi:hypothetical protein